MDGDQLSKMKTEQQLADKDVDEHRREMNEKRAAEEREAMERKRQQDEAARRAEEDFKKNRKKYEKEEAMISARIQEEEKELEVERRSWKRPSRRKSRPARRFHGSTCSKYRPRFEQYELTN